jgi:hypothetical protein
MKRHCEERSDEAIHYRGCGVRVITVSEHSEVRTHATRETGDRGTLDIGVADLRGSLP